MNRYILRRLWTSIPVLLIITAITFLMINLAPGDMLDFMFEPGEGGSIENIEALREALGLNKPIHVRYAIWLGRLLRGHLGYSGMTSMPVTRVIKANLGSTLILMASAMIFSIGLGIPLGVISALRRYSLIDNVISLFSFVWIALPGFFLALGALYLFSLKIPLFPAFGMRTPVGSDNPTLDLLHHLVLPTIVLGLSHLAAYVRYTRSSVLEVLNEDFVRTARAKGLRERVVIYGHAVRAALIPLVTVISLRLPQLIGGAVLIETIFAWPGLGRISVRAIATRDYPSIMAFNLITALAVMAANMIADIAYGIVDPRIRYE